MKIPEKKLNEAEVFETLERYRANDNDWRAGRTWGYVFDAGREIEAVAKKAYMAFLSENALDPTIFPSLLRLENEVVGMALAHVRAPDGAAGNFTSGGTESIILAVKAARDAFREKHPGVGQPEMVLPVTAHAAFHKAAHYLGVKAVTIRSTPPPSVPTSTRPALPSVRTPRSWSARRRLMPMAPSTPSESSALWRWRRASHSTSTGASAVSCSGTFAAWARAFPSSTSPSPA